MDWKMNYPSVGRETRNVPTFPDEKIRLNHEDLGFQSAEFKGEKHKKASSPERFFPPGGDFFFLVATIAHRPRWTGIEKCSSRILKNPLPPSLPRKRESRKS
jgi:hypothetical protein